MATPEMLNEMTKELVKALEITMNPSATQASRQEAYTAYEHFKECSPYAAQVGLFLVQSEKLQGYVVHFGLQLMEHCVKYRWNQLSQAEKVFIKENTMRLLMAGTQTEVHIKDGLSRIVVEMIKREWPQQWPTLLAELNVASTQGTIQAEIVLLIFLRLCEDVAVLQTIESTQRRKDIYQALTTNMADIFSFFLQLITLHVDLFKKAPSLEVANGHFRVVQAGLSTLASFVEWVNYTHISNDNHALLIILCTLLEDEHFQIGAVECLLQIVSRKGSMDEKKYLLEQFDIKALGFMLNAANIVSTKSLNENNYLFLKKLTQVLTALGSHFSSLWSKDESASVVRSAHLDVYLNVMLTFSRHPSLTIVNYANSVWSSFFKHQVLSRDPVFQKYIPQWFETAAPKIIRVIYPVSRKPTTDQDTAAVLDFDSEEEFSIFFLKTRTELLDTFRRVTDIAPYVTYTYVDKWLRTLLEQSIQEISNNEQNFCTTTSPLYMQWDAMANLLDRVLNRLVHIESHARPSISSGLELLELCLNFSPIDPLILSLLLSCISALFVFLSMATAEQSVSILPRVLDKIFGASVFLLPGQTKVNRSRAVKNVRRHAGALLVKIGQRYPLLLLPLFDQINTTVQTLNKDSLLSKMEQVTLQEALLLICNHFNDYNKQLQFIGDVTRSGTELWFEMDHALRSAQDFMSFVGLDKPPADPNTDDIIGQNRSQIVFCTHLFFSVLIRSTWPEDPDRAARGGFVVGRTGAGNPIYRNPAAPHIIPVIPNVLALIGVLNALWTPEAIAALAEEYKGVNEMLEADKAVLLSVHPHVTLDQTDNYTKVQTPLEKVQRFLHNVHENCFHILGSAGPSLGKDFYQIPQLGPALITSIFSNLEFVADYKIRPMIRTFLKTFISSCPKVHYEDVLLPVLSIFLPYMLTRLTKKWEYIIKLKIESNLEEENSDTQEVLDEKVNSLITREFSDLIKICLVGGTSDSSLENEAMEQDEGGEPTGHRNVNHVFAETLSELGLVLIRNESTRQIILLALLRLLSWNDSSACYKSTGLLHSVIRQLSVEEMLTEDVVTYVMTTVLQALQTHSLYEPLQGLLLTLGAQLYEVLRPKFPCVLNILMQIPNVNQQDLHKFDEKILNSSQNHKSNYKVDKTTRDLFRRITHPLFGRSVSELFKKEIKIMDLPKMSLPKRKPDHSFDFDYGTELNRLLSSGP